jgi:hypothetical protein
MEMNPGHIRKDLLEDRCRATKGFKAVDHGGRMQRNRSEGKLSSIGSDIDDRVP